MSASAFSAGSHRTSMLWNGEGVMSSRYAATKRSLAGGPVEERSPCIALMESEGNSTLSVHETGSASTTTVVISLPPSEFMLFFTRTRSDAKIGRRSSFPASARRYSSLDAFSASVSMAFSRNPSSVFWLNPNNRTSQRACRQWLHCGSMKAAARRRC